MFALQIAAVAGIVGLAVLAGVNLAMNTFPISYMESEHSGKFDGWAAAGLGLMICSAVVSVSLITAIFTY